MKRHNDDGMPNQKDFASLRIHNSFPPKKEAMDTDKHPDRHVPDTEHRHGTALETNPQVPAPSETDKNPKGPRYPFKGANS